jgi:hypothetical protein
VSRAIWRAFDTAVRTKPPAFAADAGPMHIQWSGGAVWRSSRAVRGSVEGKGAGWEAGGTAKRWLGKGGKQR